MQRTCDGALVGASTTGHTFHPLLATGGEEVAGDGCVGGGDHLHRVEVEKVENGPGGPRAANCSARATRGCAPLTLAAKREILFVSFRGSGNRDRLERPTMLFTATIRRQDPWTTVRLVGDLDLLSQPIAVGAVDGVMNAGSDRVMLDLAGLTFIDTSGAAGILRMQRKAERLGVDLVVVNANRTAVKVLEVCGFREVRRAPEALAC